MAASVGGGPEAAAPPIAETTTKTTTSRFITCIRPANRPGGLQIAITIAPRHAHSFNRSGGRRISRSNSLCDVRDLARRAEPGVVRPLLGRPAPNVVGPLASRPHLARVALVDGDTVLASAKRYRFDATLDGKPLRVIGLGAIFTQPEHRRSGAERHLVEEIVAAARAARA